MDKEAAKSLVKETLGKPFDKERYTDLVRNILNRFEEKTFDHRGSLIYSDFADSIHRFQRIGEYENGGKKINILIVYLKKATSLERARSKQRNFVAKWLKQGRAGSPKDAALVAFVPIDNKDDWRFSFVKMEYRFDEKGKVIEEFTPARRYSFLVGENENSHTAQSCLLPLLQQDDHPILGDLEEAFSVEKVTKEFFGKYRELYLRLEESLKEIVKKDSKVKADFEEKNIKSDDSDGLGDFAKKLLGQIVFLYFLQKKGWFGVKRGEQWGSGSRHFLRELFKKDHGDYKNFFNDILEPLFYEALRVGQRSEDYYKHFDSRIPFLNGGLFDPMNEYDWVNTEILIPDTIFSNDRKTKEGTGDGILDIFDRYNFTVKEDEPLEREVAVDPEMLGKVFENLLAVGDRKDLGTYYTPREIVHYMCQESLVNYLTTELVNEVSKKDIKVIREDIEVIREDINILVKHGEQVLENDSQIMKKGKETKGYSFKLPGSIREHAEIIDQKLKTIQVCDPAVGSGAFIVGMMNEIVGIRKALTPHLSIRKRSAYQFKQHAIQNCLYGVDIAPGAVEITKLRLWLSLVVDEKDRETIQPLPNLDFKIMQGNSLISKFKGLDFDALGRGGHLFINDTINKLETKKHEYLNETSKSKKDNLKSEIENLMISICEDHITSAGTTPGFDLRKFKSQLHDFFSKNKVKQFFPWKLYFAEVFHDDNPGFDIVIANPPYKGEKGSKEIFREIKESFLGEFYQGKMDIFYFFFHLGLNLSNSLAHIIFITTNYYITATGAKKLRNDFKKRAIIKCLINFNELKLFESASGQHNMITLLQRKQSGDVSVKVAMTQRNGTATTEALQNILGWEDKKTSYYEFEHSRVYGDQNNYIRLDVGSTIFKLLDKLDRGGVLLKTLCNINQGIITGADKVTKKHIQKYDIDAEIGKGIFILSNKEINGLCLSDEEQKLIKPWFKNSNIRRYWTQKKAKEKIIYLDNFFVPAADSKLIRHLEKFKESLQERRDVHKGNRNWFTLSWCRDSNIFSGAKIVVPQRSQRNTFGYNEIPWYASADVYFITAHSQDPNVSLKYILALLNSSLYYLWFYHRGKRKGEMLELYQIPLSETPIKKVMADEQKPFIELVNKILAITKTDDYFQNSTKQNKVHEYEREIDQLVYKLYDLTDEEIKVVEQSNK